MDAYASLLWQESRGVFKRERAESSHSAPATAGEGPQAKQELRKKYKKTEKNRKMFNFYISLDVSA